MENANAMNVDDNDKIDLLVSICGRLADILKDPTEGGTRKDMSAEARSEARTHAHDDLLGCVDTLASFAQFYHGYFEALNIASKLHLNVTPTTT